MWGAGGPKGGRPEPVDGVHTFAERDGGGGEGASGRGDGGAADVAGVSLDDSHACGFAGDGGAAASAISVEDDDTEALVMLRLQKIATDQAH